MEEILENQSVLLTKSKFGKVRKKNPTISIITVVLNGEKTLASTIDSVINQTYQDIELIIIDGGSNDGTVKLIKQFEEHICYWISEPDNGIYDGMNKGIRAFNGDYLIFLNCGDYFANSKVLEKVSKFIIKFNPDILYGNFYVHDSKNLKLLKIKIDSDYDLYRETVCHQSIFISKGVVQKVGEFNIVYKICADREWLLRAIKNDNYKLTYFDSPVSVFDRSGISSKQRGKLRIENLKINYKYFKSKFYRYLFKQTANKLKRF